MVTENRGILPISFPQNRISCYILSRSVQLRLIPNDMLIVVALPQSLTKRIPQTRLHTLSVTHRRYGLKCSHDITQRRGNPCGCPVPAPLGTHKGYPYTLANNYDAVNMIWHDYKGVEPNCWEPFGQLIPNLADHSTRSVDMHFIFNHVSKQT